MSQVEGRNPVLEAVRGRLADRVLVGEDTKSARKIEEIVDLAQRAGGHHGDEAPERAGAGAKGEEGGRGERCEIGGHGGDHPLREGEGDQRDHRKTPLNHKV
ncbi:hypothetical protein KAV47_04620 [Candidatus Bathyarchaeota archaeon]|nr:hypothetical protein [Candidatus Bathyarchaeota archaeon]